MHAELDQRKTELQSSETPIYLPPGDSLEAWRKLPYKRGSWMKVLTYWVNEMRWRKAYWGKDRN
jgi:hypothetical protein